MMAPMVAATIELRSSAPSIGFVLKQDAGQEPADERADDAQHDVTDDAEALVTLDEETGQVPGDGAEDQPGDDAHGFPPLPSIGRPGMGHAPRL